MDDVLREIIEVQSILHGAGTLSRQALLAIAKHAADHPIEYSVETGCGATTLLLSHLSRNHTVFALDVGASVTNVRSSRLLRPGVVTFVEGPSQQSLPRFGISKTLQLALIDGPHAYPFPDLEYYYLYPHLDPGALLILDDIHIPSVHNLFDFLRSDAMFQLEKVVRTTAFFKRTDKPTFDPFGDGWQEQNYNARTLFRYDWRSRLASVFPQAFRSYCQTLARSSIAAKQDSFIGISYPRSGDRVGSSGLVEGRAKMFADCYLWVLVHRKDIDGWWPQGGDAIAVVENSWSVTVKYGDAEDHGCKFEIAAVAVSRAIHERLRQWVQSVETTGMCPPVQLPKGESLIGASFRTVTKGSAQDTSVSRSGRGGGP